MKTRKSKQLVIDYLKRNSNWQQLDVNTLAIHMDTLTNILIAETIKDWEEFRKTMPSHAHLEQYVRMFVNKVNQEPETNKPEFTKEDLKAAFKNGRLYEASELELDLDGVDDVFDAWYYKIFAFRNNNKPQ